MGRFRVVQGRYFLELAVVVVPLIAILVLQYVSSRRLAEVEVVARQTAIAQYLDAVAADVRSLYEDAAHEVLNVPGDAVVTKKFDEVVRHFASTDTSTARLLFASALDGCLCLTRYYDPAKGETRVGAEDDIEAVVLRASTLLYVRDMLPLDRTILYVDEADPDNRVVYRFVTGSDADRVGMVGFLVDSDRFEREYLPQAVSGAMDLLAPDVHDNLIVRVADANGQAVVVTHDEPGQADLLKGRFDFLFRDWELSVRSRHMGAKQVLASNAFTSWVLTVLMSVAVLGGVLLTWRAAGRERRLARIRNAFVANVSHELRTPIASLAVFGEFMRRGRVRDPEQVVEYGRRIEHESDRLRHLIDNVLNFARIESVGTQHQPEEAAIEDVVAAAINAIDARRQRDGFAISVSWPSTLSPTVRIDARAMTQVFINLLDNAMKFSSRSRRVTVDLFRAKDHVAVRVADSGIGIAPEDHERIFRQFYRTTTAVGNRVNGTGLGLAIARHVVLQHGGSIEVDSRLGHGASFTVRIPVASAASCTPHDASNAVKSVRISAGAEA